MEIHVNVLIILLPTPFYHKDYIQSAWGSGFQKKSLIKSNSQPLIN